MKGVALELADMQAYLDKRIKTDEALQQDIQDTFKELNRWAGPQRGGAGRGLGVGWGKVRPR